MKKPSILEVMSGVDKFLKMLDKLEKIDWTTDKLRVEFTVFIDIYTVDKTAEEQTLDKTPDNGADNK